MNRAIFLDRDGVINRMVYNPEFGTVDSPANPEEFEMIPGVSDGIRQINDMGYLAVVISNQPGVAKGKMTNHLLELTMQKMADLLKLEGAYLDGIYYCMHHPQAKLTEYRTVCDCRKPKPGLLYQAATDLDINIKESYFIGDGITDVVAANEAGCTSILVNSRKCYLCDELSRQKVQPDYIAKELLDALRAIKLIENKVSEKVEPYKFNCRLDNDC